MATATTGGTAASGAAFGLTAAKTRFVALVSAGTGLAPDVVAAWVLAEGGPDVNPLNLRPGRSYGSAENAASEVVKTLHSPQYSGVLRSGQDRTPNSVQHQLDAIALSPWDLGRVGPKPRYRALLGGTYARVRAWVRAHADDPIGSFIGGVAGSTVGALGGNPADNPGTAARDAVTGWVGDLTGWAEGAGLRVLAYFVLTVVAVALFVLGVARLSGVSPRSVLAGRGGGAGGAPDTYGEVPF